MDSRFLLALSLALLTPACSALVAPDTNRLGGNDAAGLDGSFVDAARPDGATPDGALPDGGVRDAGNDGGPVCPASCDDAVACTTDTCDASEGVCRHEPDGDCGTGMRCAGPAGCVPILCTTNDQCDDGDRCDGDETCNPRAAGASPTTGCVPGTTLDCDDHVACTVDSCEPTPGCLHALDHVACDDAAACTTDTCTATGCMRAPDSAMCNRGCITGAFCTPFSGCTGGVTMTCSPDTSPCTDDPTACDAASGTCLHPPRDADGDTHPALRVSGMLCAGGTDCNDTVATIHPGATEACNGVDDNCDGAIDEGCPVLPDTCATEQRITLVSSGGPSRGSVTGSNAALADHYRASCVVGTMGAVGGRDAVYFFDLPAPSASLDVTISTDNPGTTFDTVIAAQVGGTCSAFGRACDDDSGDGSTSETTFCVSGSTSSARVHVLVDGFNGETSSVGTYELSVEVRLRGSPCPG